MRDAFFFGGLVFVMLVFTLGFSGVIVGNVVLEPGDESDINWDVPWKTILLFSSIGLVICASQYPKFKGHRKDKY